MKIIKIILKIVFMLFYVPWMLFFTKFVIDLVPTYLVADNWSSSNPNATAFFSVLFLVVPFVFIVSVVSTLIFIFAFKIEIKHFLANLYFGDKRIKFFDVEKKQ